MKTIGKGIAALLAAFLATGCVSVRQTYTSKGLSAYSISCSAPFRSWRSCLVKAGRLCGARGYSVVHSDEVERFLVVSCPSPTTEKD